MIDRDVTVCKFCDTRAIDMSFYKGVKGVDDGSPEDVKRMQVTNTLLHLYNMHDCTCDPPKDKDKMEWPDGLSEVYLKK